MAAKDTIKNKAYEIFKAKCIKMITSKFLLAQPCIASILKCIILSPDLYQFFKDIITNIDCENELYKATAEREGMGFRLPESKRVMVALVTYLLNQFDNNEIDLMEFISYYYNIDHNKGYQVFCNEVIEPYIVAVSELFLPEGMEDTIIEQEPDNLNYAVYEQADIILRDLINDIQGCNSVTEEERRELLVMIEGMMIAVANFDTKIIMALWIGMKYSFAKHRKLYRQLKELEKLFIKYLVI